MERITRQHPWSSISTKESCEASTDLRIPQDYPT